MIDAAAVLAKLAGEADGDTSSTTAFFATVTAATSSSVTVLPDSSLDGTSVGPVALVGTAALAVGDRVLCIRDEGGGIACLGKVV